MTEAAASPMPTTPEAARTVLDGRIADKDWGAKLLKGDAPTRTEWDTLSKIASGDPEAIAAAKAVAPSLSGETPMSIEQLAAASAAGLHDSQVTQILASV